MPPRASFALVAAAVDAHFPGHSWRAFCRWAEEVRHLSVQPYTVTRARQGSAEWLLDWSEALADYLLIEHPGSELRVAEIVWGHSLSRLGVRIVPDDVVAGSLEEELHGAALAALDLATRHARATLPDSPGGKAIAPDEQQGLLQAATLLRQRLDALIVVLDDSPPTAQPGRPLDLAR